MARTTFLGVTGDPGSARKDGDIQPNVKFEILIGEGMRQHVILCSLLEGHLVLTLLKWLRKINFLDFVLMSLTIAKTCKSSTCTYLLWKWPIFKVLLRLEIPRHV